MGPDLGAWRGVADALLGVLLVVVMSGCGDAERSAQSAVSHATSATAATATQPTVPADTPTAAQRQYAYAAARELRKHGALLAGPFPPKAVEAVHECDPPARNATIIACYWGRQGTDGEDPIGFRVRL